MLAKPGLLAVLLSGVLTAGCQLHLYDKAKDTEAASFKENVAAVSFDETFKVARANHTVASEAIAGAAERSAIIRAKLRLFSVLAYNPTTAPAGGAESEFAAVDLGQALKARWAELTCFPGAGDSDCPDDAQMLRRWIEVTCGGAASTDPRCRGIVNASDALKEGLAVYDPNTPHRLNRRIKEDIADILTVAGIRPGECLAKIDENGVPEKGEDGSLRANLPSGDDFLASLPEEKRTGPAVTTYEHYLEDCGALLTAQNNLDALFETNTGSETAYALAAWRAARARLTAEAMAAAAARGDYQAANKTYRDALDALSQGLGSEDDVKELLTKAGKALDALGGLSSNHMGAELAATERIGQLRQILAALGGGETGGGEAEDQDAQLTDAVRQRLAVIATVPHLIDEVDTLFDAAEEARATPLVLELAYQEQVLNGAKRRLAATMADVVRAEQGYLARVGETERIAFAMDQHREAASKLGDLSRQPLYDALNGADRSPSPGQERLLDALTAYYESQVKYRPTAERLLFDDTAAAFQRNLDADETALNQWLGLIKGDSAVLATYFASGVKPEVIADLLIKLIGLSAIGVGVNL